MRNKAYIVLRKIVAQLSHTSLLVFLFISFGLWYVNKLSHSFITEVEIPVMIRNSASAEIGIVQPEYVILCRVQGTGYQLLTYKWFPRRNGVTVNLTSLTLAGSEEEEYRSVTPVSLFNAVSNQLRDLRLEAILSPALEVRTSPLSARKVPVIARIDVEPGVRYMQTRPVRLRPDSIEIKSLEAILDTLKGIFTEEKTFLDVTGSLSGRIPLMPIAGLIYPVDEVEYFVEVEEFTEVDLVLPLAVKNVPEGLSPILLPDEISLVLHVSRSFYGDASADKVGAYVDYADRHTNLGDKFRVYVEANEKVFVKEIDPYYVELIFAER